MTTNLMPLLLKRWVSAQSEAFGAGLYVDIFEGYRTPERQNLLYARGRTQIGNIITNARAWESWHQYGCAIDVTFDGDQLKPGFQHSWAGDYKKLAPIMIRHGFRWSGKFKFFGGLSGEICHFQMTGDLTLLDAYKTYKESGIEAVWEKVAAYYARTQV